MTNGRPLRFLALVLGGWTGLRVLVLWQAVAPPGATLPLPLVGLALADTSMVSRPLHDPVVRLVVPPRPVRAASAAASAAMPTGTTPEPRLPAGDHRDGAALAAASFRSRRAEPIQTGGAITPPLRPTPIAAARSRLAGSAWLIARGGSGIENPLLGGQLGGSQAGARLTYTIGAGRHVALSARIATPLNGPGREAAIGLDWQPTRAPLHLLAEQRLSLDGGHGGPTLMAIGGVGPVPIAAGFRVEAYGEGGAIARAPKDGGVEGFGDGAARLTRPLAAVGRAHLDLGGGGWGAVQRGVQRLDVGPTLGLVAPLGRKTMRLTVDWRERVAGNARPGSGPALSLGADF